MGAEHQREAALERLDLVPDAASGYKTVQAKSFSMPQIIFNLPFI